MMSQIKSGTASAGHHQCESPTSSTGTPDSFNYETKFMVLNFMSRSPHELSPLSFNGTSHTCTSDSDPLLYGQKISSRSLPSSPPKRYISRHSRMNNLKLAHQRVSEDNIHYKYKKHQKAVEDTTSGNGNDDYRMRQRVSEDNISHKYKKLHASFDCASSLESSTESLRKLSRQCKLKSGTSFESPSASGTSLDRNSAHDSEKANNATAGSTPQSRDSMSLSQYRQCTLSRMGSQLSGDYSYTSDADDEYEDTSCGSSFGGSMGNVNAHQRLSVDLHQVVSRLPTVMSESEMENDTILNPNNISMGDSEIGSTMDSANAPVFDIGAESIDQSTVNHTVKSTETCNLSDINLEIEYDDMDSTYENDPAVSTSISLEASSSNSSTTNCKTLDRSKLRLNIQDPQIWEASKAAKFEAIAASLRSEIEDEMTTLESEVEDAIKKNVIPSSQSPFLTPMTPQTQAAKVLARIGDEVMEQYEEQLEASVALLLQYSQRLDLTYDTFKEIASEVVDKDLPGWRQVALLLVYGQKAAWKLVETGNHGIGDLVDYTSRLVADRAAEFIIKQGGWGAVMNTDSSLSSDSPIVSTPDSLRDVPSLPIHEHELLIAPPVTTPNGHISPTVDEEARQSQEELSVNNNSFTETSQPITAFIPQIPAGLVEGGVSSSSSSDDEGQAIANQGQIISTWYHWFVIPENVALLSCTLAAIGLGFLLSNSR